MDWNTMFLTLAQYYVFTFINISILLAIEPDPLFGRSIQIHINVQISSCSSVQLLITMFQHLSLDQYWIFFYHAIYAKTPLRFSLSITHDVYYVTLNIFLRDLEKP